jgi:polar amino acid transport system substrate-binding protein
MTRRAAARCYGSPPGMNTMERRSNRRTARWVVGACALVSLVVAAGCGDTATIGSIPYTPATPGTLRVATALPAPGFWEGGDTPESITGGYEYELATLLADRFDLELELVAVPFEQIASGDLGGADMAIAQISRTESRGRVVDFSTPYLDTSIGVLATTGDEIDDLKEARERTWAVVDGSIEQAFLDEIVLPDSDPVVVADEVAAAAAIEAGEADAALIDLPSALIIAGGSDRLEVVSQFVNEQQYAIALPRSGADHQNNLAAVDTAVRAFAANGTLDDLFDEWLDPRFESSPDRVPVIPARTPRSTP